MHKPGHLREAFAYLTEYDVDSYVEVFYARPMPPLDLLTELSDCTDIMPGDLCESLRLPSGCNYAVGAGAFLASSDTGYLAQLLRD